MRIWVWTGRGRRKPAGTGNDRKGTGIFMSLLQMSFSGAILILGIIVVRRMAINKLPKKIFIALWAVALIRLLFPFSVPSAFSVYSLL